MGSLNAAYSQEVDNWSVTNPGKAVGSAAYTTPQQQQSRITLNTIKKKEKPRAPTDRVGRSTEKKKIMK